MSRRYPTIETRNRWAGMNLFIYSGLKTIILHKTFDKITLIILFGSTLKENLVLEAGSSQLMNNETQAYDTRDVLTYQCKTGI